MSSKRPNKNLPSGRRPAPVAKGTHPVVDELTGTQRRMLEQAVSLVAKGAVDEALTLAQQVTAERPGAFGPRHLLGRTLFNAGRWDEALVHYEELVARFPQHPDAYSNLAGVLSTLGYQERAFHAIERALQLNPHSPVAMLNLAEILRNLGNWTDARDTYGAALQISPDDPKLHLQHGMSLVALGDWSAGWRKMEHREFVEGARLYPEPVPSPRWRGDTPIAGQRLLVSYEQGLGDSIMCARFARTLAEQGAVVHLRTPEALVPLLSTVRGVASCTATESPMPEHDLHIPLMSLLSVLDVRPDSLDPSPYISPPGACPPHIEALIPDDDQLNVAIAWSGNPRHPNDRRRSIRGELLQTLFQVPGIRFLAMQKYPAMDVVLPEALRPDVTDLGAACRDFSESAHALRRVDVTVCVDSAVAHLAGALGVPTMLCVPFAAEFRWGTQGETTPWYASVTLMRQSRMYDWPSVLDAVAEQLRQRAAEKVALRRARTQP